MVCESTYANATRKIKSLNNLRVWCRDLEQSCAESDWEIQGRYKIHIQERIWSESIEIGFDGTRAEMLGCFFVEKIHEFFYNKNVGFCILTEN